MTLKSLQSHGSYTFIGDNILDRGKMNVKEELKGPSCEVHLMAINSTISDQLTLTNFNPENKDSINF